MVRPIWTATAASTLSAALVYSENAAGDGDEAVRGALASKETPPVARPATSALKGDDLAGAILASVSVDGAD